MAKKSAGKCRRSKEAAIAAARLADMAGVMADKWDTMLVKP